MVNVVIAGGTGQVGRAIAEILHQNAENKVLIFSRQAPSEIGLHVTQANYADIDQLTALFEEHQIHVVISTLATHHQGAGDSQINLIKAADKSACTKRFIVSSWGSPLTKDQVEGFPELQGELDAIEAVQKTGLEWTVFRNGCFMDYYGMPHVKTYLTPIPFAIDVANKVAAIPGTGNELVTFTYTFDVGKFVDAALRLPKWDPETYVVGDQLTLNDFVKLAEQARRPFIGSTFTIHYDDEEKLKKFKITELPAHASAYKYFPKEELQRIFATFGLCYASGMFETTKKQLSMSLNKVFPQIKPITVKGMLMQNWNGR